MVTRQLRTAIVVVPGMNGVNALAASLLGELVHQTLSDAVDAAYCRHYPYLVTDAHLSILTDVAFKGALLVFDVADVAFCIYGLIRIFQCP